MVFQVGIFACTYSIVLIFRGSLILRISRIWNRSRNYFSENFDTSKLSHIDDVKAAHSRNYFNEIKKTAIRENLDPRNISAIQYIFTRNKNQWSGSRPAGYPSDATVIEIIIYTLERIRGWILPVT